MPRHRTPILAGGSRKSGSWLRTPWSLGVFNSAGRNGCRGLSIIVVQINIIGGLLVEEYMIRARVPRRRWKHWQGLSKLFLLDPQGDGCRNCRSSYFLFFGAGACAGAGACHLCAAADSPVFVSYSTYAPLGNLYWYSAFSRLHSLEYAFLFFSFLFSRVLYLYSTPSQAEYYIPPDHICSLLRRGCRGRLCCPSPPPPPALVRPARHELSNP